MTQSSSLNNDENSEFTDAKKTGNKFGGGIEFREGSPIQLLRYSEKTENEKFGQILLNPKALDVIREINEPLAIISVGK
jgi:hypothetical protein